MQYPGVVRTMLRCLLRAGEGKADFCLRCLASSAAPREAETLDLPGGKVPLSTKLNFIGGPDVGERVPTYRTIDMTGRGIEGAQVPHALDRELAVKIYAAMCKLQVTVHAST